ncbi:MAG: S8 family serine peptidase, partial [Thermoanaerobaculia bacterium]
IHRNAVRIYAKWRVVPGFAATVDDTELERLRNDPDVLSVEPDLGGSVTAVSNGEEIGPNGELIGLSAVHALGYDGTGSTVAVLDTGVSPHPDLNGRIVEERCYCAYANSKGCCPNGKASNPAPAPRATISRTAQPSPGSSPAAAALRRAGLRRERRSSRSAWPTRPATSPGPHR